jgi:hypothetical protein
MKKALFALALCASLAGTHAAFADRWTVPNNGTLSAMTMPSGDVMMKVQLPQAAFAMMDRNMKANHNTCTIKEIYPGATYTMILVCGPSA